MEGMKRLNMEEVCLNEWIQAKDEDIRNNIEAVEKPQVNIIRIYPFFFPCPPHQNNSAPQNKPSYR